MFRSTFQVPEKIWRCKIDPSNQISAIDHCQDEAWFFDDRQRTGALPSSAGRALAMSDR